MHLLVQTGTALRRGLRKAEVRDNVGVLWENTMRGVEQRGQENQLLSGELSKY